ncbi:DUF2523 family protein [Caballeronia zhejiangensis]|uniref:DUF2523 family protein n=1 Tax=Caballeronia zhejiangensis TaxID=871203 RepID=UPI00158D9710|nr:DUF2523 family protein [Caballeronia zhejiangensis]MCI1042236.1 DUF2523 domain-containing protein [Caballeronia zhejiangensis]
MYAVLLSAGWSLLSWLLRSVLIKFVVYFALFFFVSEAVQYLQSSSVLPDASVLSNAFGGIGQDVWYFLDLCSFSYGAQVILAAFAARFVIRRLPLIG